MIRRYALWALLCVAPRLHAQTHPQPELRVDVLGPPPYSIQPGLGGTLAFGHYARVTGAIGYAVAPDTNEVSGRWRGDLLARFVLDPFRQHRWGASVGGGVSVRRRTSIAALLELESPETGGWLAALQLGVSGGVRAGLVFRRAVQGRR